ncbi:RHS repeat-associated core domain-containing protein [Paenarthrobacter sp. NPDC058040]|uniref:RHS repeat-associated core domain-containing protein n=1 Tax=unclassified Paenarthrobacter TaxID=2634190 RepID=UPI0036D7D193
MSPRRKATGSMRRRLTLGVAGVGLSCALATSTLTPSYASLVNSSTSARAETLATAQNASQGLTRSVPFVAPKVEDGQGPVKDAPYVATGAVRPGQESAIRADQVGAKVRFSGHEIKDPLEVSVKELADGAARTAAAETAGVVLNSAVQITATAPDGQDITSFPADPTIIETPDGPDVVAAVDPGVGLELAIDETRLGTTAGKVDPASVRIMTRENPGDPWVELPSYYDKATGKVRGESDHLSQFVVIGTPFAPPAGPRVVLDPDDDVATTTGPGGAMTELPQNVRLANEVAAMMTATCKADVLVTRPTASPRFISPQTRAAMAAAHNPDLTVTLAFDALFGHPWGTAADGGTKAYSRGGPDDNAVTNSLIAQMPAYTGRPAKQDSAGATTPLPYPDLGSLPGAVAHLETLNIDHNYDRPVIDHGFASITNGVFTGLGKYLETKGFNCTNPTTGGWPSKPSAAELAKWRNLGFHNYQAYGAEPVSFTTGNLIEKFPLFTLTGPGKQNLDLSLVYNSQDGRLSRTGAGVSFGLGARVQRFDDGSVLAVRGDGASYVFTGNGAGGFTAEAGTLNFLSDAGNGRLLLASLDGESWLFDASDGDGIGELVRHTDRQGNTTTLVYGLGTPETQFLPLASITDAAGQTVAVGSDDLGRVTSFTHPDSRIWRLAYDAAGNLAVITEPDGRTRSFTYDGAHQLIAAIDPLGVLYLRNEYDDAGRVVKQWDAQSNERSFTYDDAAKTTTYVDNEGNKTVYTRDDNYRVTSIVDAAGGDQKFSYDGNNQVTGYTDQNGHTTSYAYDTTGHVTSTTAPDGSVTSYTYTRAGDLASSTDTGGPGGATRTTSFDNDASGLPVTAHLPDGTSITNAFDGRGNLTASTDQLGHTTTYGYDGRGNLDKTTDPLGRTSTFAYDAANRVTAATDPRGNTTTFAWDTADRLVTQTDADGGVTALSYDGNNHLTSTTDPTGAVTTYEWDTLFRVASVTNPDGGKTTYAYNREDELTRITDPLGAETSFELDPLYRITKTIDPLGGAWTQTWDKAGNLLTATDPEDGTTSTSYDVLNRVTSTTDPTGANTQFTLDSVGRTTAVTDPAGGVRKFEYDAMDRLVRAVDQSGNATTTTYDKAGNTVTVTDRRGQAWKRSYDAAGQLTSSTDPTGAGSSFGYDANGNRTTVTDPLKRVTTAAYDAMNRAVAVKNPAGETTTTTYDRAGRVISATDGDGDAWTRSYDIAGNLVRTLDPDGVAASYGWDLAGNQTSMTDGNGAVTAYSWDKASQLTGVTENRVVGKEQDADTNVITSYVYSPAGYLSEVTNPNGNTTKFSHDKAGRTTAETNPAGRKWTYEYDGRGLLTKQKDANGTTTTHDYTPTGDLSTVAHSTGQKTSYGYDAEQALITMDDSIGASAWTYDARGALKSQTDALGKKLFYDYDPAGQLTTLTLPAGKTSPATTGSSGGQPTSDKSVGISYSYDPAGRVKSQTSPWGSMDYNYTPAGNTAVVTRSNGVTTTTDYTPANRTKTISHSTKSTSAPSEARAAAGTAPDVLPETKPVSHEAKACTTAATYLASRALPDHGATGTNCVKTAEYLARRTLPSTDAGIAPGESLTVGYTYDKNGNTASRTRTNGTTPTSDTPVRDTRDYTYDPLSRLIGSTSSTGLKNTYNFDRNGNRIGWTTNDNPSTTTVGDPLDVTAVFDNTDQLTNETRTGPGAGTAGSATTSYAYDPNGNRTKATVAGGATTTFSYTPDNQTQSVTGSGIESTYKYDGLGRNLTSSDKTDYGIHETSTAFNGLTPIQNTDNHGTANLIPDNVGHVALQTGATTVEDRWELLDRLGSTIAQTTDAAGTGAITELSEYSDYGVQEYGTTGWDSDPNYTGNPTDSTFGTHQFHARTLDPSTATWTGQDKWRGLLNAPQTLNRYAYTLNNPTTLVDNLGYDPVRVIDGTSYDYLPASQSWEPIPDSTPAFLPVPPVPPLSIRRPDYTPSTGNSYFNRILQQAAVYTPARASAPQISATHTALNCVGNVKVGMSPEQLAINEACGNALAEANLQTKPQWAQDLVHGNQAFADKARPLVALGIAGSVGAGAGGKAGIDAPGDSGWAKASGILRSASTGKGNFGLGEATSAVDAQAGKAWVGEGARLARDGKTWVSSDGLRQWRPPTEKPRLGKVQSNYEERYQPSGQWQSNGHLDIVDLP